MNPTIFAGLGNPNDIFAAIQLDAALPVEVATYLLYAMYYATNLQSSAPALRARSMGLGIGWRERCL